MESPKITHIYPLGQSDVCIFEDSLCDHFFDWAVYLSRSNFELSSKGPHDLLDSLGTYHSGVEPLVQPANLRSSAVLRRHEQAGLSVQQRYFSTHLDHKLITKTKPLKFMQAFPLIFLSYVIVT